MGDARGWWVEKMLSCLIGIDFQFCKMKNSAYPLHNVKIVIITEPHLTTVQLVNFMCFLPQLKKILISFSFTCLFCPL